MLFAPTSPAQRVNLVSQSYHVPAEDPGTDIYVRNKHPLTMESYRSDRILLFVHGATYPAEACFDLELDGLSWMSYIAQQGFDVYLMDVRGYGRSTRPDEMNQPAEMHHPIVHTDVAVKDFSTIVDHILERRGVTKISLMGWSWGTVIAAAYTAENNEKVDRLVLYAPLWLRQGPSPLRTNQTLGAYRSVTREAALERWLNGVPAGRREELLPRGWFEKWWSANMEADPIGAKKRPQVIRAPNGVFEDDLRYWEADARYYDPSQIRVPILLVNGEWDVDTPRYMAQSVFAGLSGTPIKRHVVIGAGTHSLMMEKNRMQLFREIQTFLED